MKVDIPDEIWTQIEQKITWAKDKPISATVFLLGVALGVWIRDEQNERDEDTSRTDEVYRRTDGH